MPLNICDVNYVIFFCLCFYFSRYFLSKSSKLQVIINTLLLPYVSKAYINNEYILDASCLFQVFHLSLQNFLRSSLVFAKEQCFCFLWKRVQYLIVIFLFLPHFLHSFMVGTVTVLAEHLLIYLV